MHHYINAYKFFKTGKVFTFCAKIKQLVAMESLGVNKAVK